MPAITDEHRAAVKEIACGILEVEENEVTDTGLFFGGHGAGPLRALEILAALEREFEITIAQSEPAGTVNLERVHQVVAAAPGR
ncbi:acyl carrier protein [Streptomyces sp. NPDC054874]